MTTVAILFWAGVFLVFYTYLGYGILLWLLVKIREAVHPARRYAFPADPPEVTLLIAAYNEQEVVAEKMANCRALDYPAGKLRVTWITDGSTDRTVELLAAYPEVTVLHDPRRGGKTAALNRALGIVRTPLVVFTDANTMLNPEIHHTTYGTKNEEGSGLGLQLVQDLTRRNGGELTIESTLGEGSTFTFTIAKVQPKSETVEDSEGGGIARP